MANGYWVIRTYTAGAVGEKIKYWVPGEKPTKSERKIKSDIKQVQRNEANAEKALARLIHANFTPRDYLLQFSYTEEALEKLRAGERTEEELFEAADHQLKLWAKRTRRACKALGIPFRYIPFTSDLDGKTGEVVRVHHHIIVNAEAAEIALEKWSAGSTHREHLYDQVDQTPLAHYLLAQVRHRPNEKEPQPDRSAAEGSHRRFGRRTAGAARRAAAPARRLDARDAAVHPLHRAGGRQDPPRRSAAGENERIRRTERSRHDGGSALGIPESRLGACFFCLSRGKMKKSADFGKVDGS